MIRAGTLEDIDACLLMGARFFEESGFGAETAFDEASTRATLQHLIDSPDGALIVADHSGSVVGMVGILSYPHYFNFSSRGAQELFWWVDPGFRGGADGARLMFAAEQWARDAGCHTMMMMCLPIDSPAQRIYERTGYRACERNYIKRL